MQTMFQDLINDIQQKIGLNHNDIEIFKSYWKIKKIVKNDFLFSGHLFNF
jgi:hypothetical protein